MKRKWLTIGIILLFVGVTIAPSINFNTVKASQDEDLVEITTQAYGIKGYGNTTVKLTREQHQNLEEYLVRFRDRLNQTSTREEAIPLYKEAVVELDKYGLLPKGMNVNQAQKVVIKNFQNEVITRFIKKLYCDTLLSQDRNFFCLVAGDTTNTPGFGPITTFIETHGFILGFLLYRIFETLSVGILLFIMLFSFERDSNFPLYLYGTLCFGSYEVHEHGGNLFVPSEGWINWYGIFGKRNISGILYGKIQPILGWYSVISSDCIYYYQGIRGFTGLKIFQSNTYFYLGSCLEVNVNATEPEPPEITK